MSGFVPLDERLKNKSLKSPLLKRKCELMSKDKRSSDESDVSIGPGESYDGPTIESRKLRLFTAPMPQFPLHPKPILPGPRLGHWTDCRDEAVALLEEESFDYTSVSILRIGGDAASPDRFCILIEAANMEQRMRWRDITISLCLMLYVQDCLDLDVGIIAKEPARMNVFSIPYDHPFMEVWQQTAQTVLSLIRPFDWEALDVLLCGEASSRAQPKVFITIQDMTQSGLSILEDQIANLFKSVAVECVEGQIEG